MAGPLQSDSSSLLPPHVGFCGINVTGSDPFSDKMMASPPDMKRSTPKRLQFLASCVAATSLWVGGTCHAQSPSDSHADAFSYSYKGTAQWSLDREGTKGDRATSSQIAPAMRARHIPLKPLLPILPATAPVAAEVHEPATITTKKTTKNDETACTNRVVIDATPTYYERISIKADGTVPTSSGLAAAETTTEDEDSGLFSMPARTTLVAFRETTVDITRDTVKGFGEAVRTSRGMAAELAAQMDIIRPRKYCADCGQRHRRTPVRRFMAMLRGSQKVDDRSAISPDSSVAPQSNL